MTPGIDEMWTEVLTRILPRRSAFASPTLLRRTTVYLSDALGQTSVKHRALLCSHTKRLRSPLSAHQQFRSRLLSGIKYSWCYIMRLLFSLLYLQGSSATVLYRQHAWRLGCVSRVLCIWWSPKPCCCTKCLNGISDRIASRQLMLIDWIHDVSAITLIDKNHAFVI